MENQQIKSIILDLVDNKPLVDAHRHSLYDIGKIKGLKDISVDEWSKSLEFISYQKKTKKLYGHQLFCEIINWLRFSQKEGVRSVLDFSAKHAEKDLKKIYEQCGVRNFSLLKLINFKRENYKNTVPEFIILPDERLMTLDILNQAKEYAKMFPKVRFTMHCLESRERLKIAKHKFSMSTIEWFTKHNFLNKRLLLVHVNEVSTKDINLIRDHEAKIVLCSLMRKPLQYRTPNIPLDIPIYFGTDAPLISKNRSLLDVAVQQVGDWVNTGIDRDCATNIASKALTRIL
jgi:hypothetical protein